MILSKFCEKFGENAIYDITTEDSLSFLDQLAEGKKRQTRKIRYSHLMAFFNFVKNSIDKEYIRNQAIKLDNRIFPISYPAARTTVKKAGRLVGINLRPHDLRRHAATYASRSGTPIEIVSKVILRHANLSTTQRYLGKVSDLEAMRWIENLYG